MRTLTRSLATALLVTLAVPASAEVTPHPLFSDGAVLQRGKPVTVWGTAVDGDRRIGRCAPSTLQRTGRESATVRVVRPSPQPIDKETRRP